VTPSRPLLVRRLFLRSNILRDQTTGEPVSAETRHTRCGSAVMRSPTLPSSHCMVGVTHVPQGGRPRHASNAVDIVIVEVHADPRGHGNNG
jgi:hypothetical protein